MSDEITYAAVIKRIESSAKEIIDAQAPFPKENTAEAWGAYQEALESCLDNSRDMAWEEVDSWDWVIYTYQGFLVYDCLPSDLQTQCEEDFWDCSGSVKDKSPYELGASMAFFALVSLLTQEIERQCEELLELAQNQMENMQ